jgi:hypothetical protein
LQAARNRSGPISPCSNDEDAIGPAALMLALAGYRRHGKCLCYAHEVLSGRSLERYCCHTAFGTKNRKMERLLRILSP